MDYHELHKQAVGELREMAGEHEDLKGVTGMSKEKLIEVLCGKMGIEMPHKVVLGIDKSTIKAKIRELKKTRDEAIAAKDRERLKRTRREIHRLRHNLRRAMKITGT